MPILILIRHGQSIWNAENKFTGWVDSPLSKKGETEAEFAGELILKENIKISFGCTSFLSRAINTLSILLKKLGVTSIPVHKAWELNERHYGSLTGKNKQEIKKNLGEKIFLQYRRSWDIAPPAIDSDKNFDYGDLNSKIPLANIPRTESLKDTYLRVIKYYNTKIVGNLRDDKTVIIGAHGNSLRALCKNLFKISNQDINNLEIPTGNPMIVELDDSKLARKAYYLDKSRAKPILNMS